MRFMSSERHNTLLPILLNRMCRKKSTKVPRKTKKVVIANMEVTAHVLFLLAILYVVLQWSVTESIRNE